MCVCFKREEKGGGVKMGGVWCNIGVWAGKGGDRECGRDWEERVGCVSGRMGGGGRRGRGREWVDG